MKACWFPDSKAGILWIIAISLYVSVNSEFICFQSTNVGVLACSSLGSLAEVLIIFPWFIQWSKGHPTYYPRMFQRQKKEFGEVVTVMSMTRRSKRREVHIGVSSIPWKRWVARCPWSHPTRPDYKTLENLTRIYTDPPFTSKFRQIPAFPACAWRRAESGERELCRFSADH